jgi:hypothetical protein
VFSKEPIFFGSEIRRAKCAPQETGMLDTQCQIFKSAKTVLPVDRHNCIVPGFCDRLFLLLPVASSSLWESDMMRK